MDFILNLLMENLDKVIYGIIIGIMYVVLKRKPSVQLIESIKGVSVSVHELVFAIMAEVARNPEKVNETLKTKLPIDKMEDIKVIKHEIAKQALIEQQNSTLDKVAKKVGGYDNLISLVYKSGRLIFKALKKK